MFLASSKNLWLTLSQEGLSAPVCILDKQSFIYYGGDKHFYISFSSPVLPGHVIDNTEDVAVATIKALNKAYPGLREKNQL